MRGAILVAVVLMTSMASADSRKPPEVPSTDLDPRFAVAVNPPLRWGGADAVAASVHVPLAAHHALRVNLATFAHDRDHVGDFLSDSIPSREGRVTDIGVGWQYFPRAHWDGFVVEAGLVRRRTDITTTYDLGSPPYEASDSTGYLARGLVGWSWLVAGRGFVAIAAGAAFGRTSGDETIAQSTFEPEYMTSRFARWGWTPEGYIRLGVVFGPR